MRVKVCNVPRCPTLVPRDRRRCDTHQRQVEQARGTRQQRGYDAEHDRERRRWAAVIARAAAPCARQCGRMIHHGDNWHLDHTDDRTGYLGPSCAPCNLSAAGKAAHH